VKSEWGEERREDMCTGFIVWKTEGKTPVGRLCHNMGIIN